MNDLTRILNAIDRGDAQAAEDLLPIVYEELRRLAARRMQGEAPGQTLQATALVHEAYIRLVGGQPQQWDGRAHFFAAAAEAMRRILIDRARQKKSAKHGGGRHRFDIDDADLTLDAVPDEIVDLDAALHKLAAQSDKKAQLVKLRFFAGMSLPDAARFLGISTSTADRYWAYARAWLYDELNRTHKGTGR